MPTLLLKLITAHLAGDYLAQPSRIASEKHRPPVLLLHTTLHGLLLVLVALTEPTSPRLWGALLVVVIAHGAIDAWTSRLAPRNLRLLTLDQSLHLASILVAVAIARPVELVSLGDGLSAAAARRETWIVVAGALAAVPAGATAIGRWVAPFREQLSDESRDQRAGLGLAGLWIGMLERLIVYAAVLGHVELLIGFVIAVKAVLRLPEARERWSRELAEYYLVGSLASLTWALLIAFAVRSLVAASS
jgi:hypothetical protein